MHTDPDAKPFADLRPSEYLRPRAVLGDWRASQAYMVGQLAISRDGRWAVSDTGGRHNEELYVWDLASGELRWWMEVSWRDQFAFHHDGEHLMVYERAEQGLRMHELSTGRAGGLLRLEGLDDPHVSQIRASSDGLRLLVGHSRVFDARTGKRLAHIATFDESSYPSFLSPQGNVVVTSKKDNSIWCHDLRTGRSTLVDEADEQILGYAMSADEKVLVTRGFECAGVYRIDGDEIEALDTLDCALVFGDIRAPGAVAMARDGARAAVSCDAAVVEVIDMRELRPEHELKIDRVHAIAFLPDGEHLLVGRYGDIVNYYDSASLEVWHIASGRRVDPPGRHGHRAGVHSFAVAPGLVCSTGVDNTVRLWSMPEGVEVEVLAPGSGRATHLDIDREMKQLLVVDSGDMGGVAFVYDLKRLGEPRWLGARSSASAMSPDGKLVAQLPFDPVRTLSIVEVSNGRVVASLPTAESPYESPSVVAWSPDSRLVLTQADSALAIHDVERRAVIVERRKKGGRIYAAAFLADGSHAWIDEDGLHVATGDEEPRTRGGRFFHNYWSHAVIAPSHDGRMIAATDGFEIWCFDAATLEERGAVVWESPRRYRLLALAFTHDDRQLFAGTSIGPILCFDVGAPPAASAGASVEGAT